MRGDVTRGLTREAMQLMVNGQMHLKSIERSVLVDCPIRAEKGCIL